MSSRRYLGSAARSFWPAVLVVCFTLLSASGGLAADSKPSPPAAAAPTRQAQLTERDKLAAEAKRLEKETKYPEAIAAAQHAIEIEKKVFGESSAEVAETLNFLAELEEWREDYSAAIAFSKDALAIATKLHGADNWRTADARRELEMRTTISKVTRDQRRLLLRADDLMNHVYEFERAGNHRDALRAVQEALQIRSSILGEDHWSTGYCIAWAGSVYRGLGDSEHAEEWFRRAAANRKQCLGENHPSYATALDNLAGMYSDRGDFAAAEPLKRQSLAIRKAAFGENDPTYAIGLHNLAHLYMEMRRFDQAEPLFREAMRINKQNAGDKSRPYSDNLDSLAQLLYQKKDYARAEELSRQAIEIKKTILGENHPDYATSLNRLALICQDAGDVGRAEVYFRECLAITQRAYGKKHPHYQTSVSNLAIMCRQSGQYEKAEKLFRQQLDDLKSFGPSTRRQQASCLNYLGLVYDDAGNFAKAENAYRQSLALFAELKAENDPLCVTVTSNLAFLYSNHGDFEQALTQYRRVVAARKETAGPQSSAFQKSSRSLSNILTSAAASNERRGKIGAAREQRQEALALLEQIPGQKASEITDARLALAHAARLEKFGDAERTRLVQAAELMSRLKQLEDQGNFREGAALAEKAAAIRTEILGDDRLTADSLYWQGALLKSAHEYDRAEPPTHRAQSIYAKVLGEDHPRYLTMLVQRANIELAKQAYPQASATYREVVARQKKAGHGGGREYRRNAERLAECLETAAEQQSGKGDFESAKKSYDEALAIWLSLGADGAWQATATRLLRDHLERMKKLDAHQQAQVEKARQLDQKAVELNLQGRSRQALPLAREAVEIRQTLLGPDDWKSLESALTLAIVLKDAGELAESQRVRSRLLPLAKSVYGDKHPEFAKVLRSEAALYSGMGDYAKAEPLYRQALSIYRQTYGDGNATYAATLNDLAINCGNRGNPVQEEYFLEQAVAAHLRAEGPQHPNYAVSLKNLAVVYSIRGDKLRAERLMTQAADILRKSVGEKDHKYAAALRSLAHLYADRRAYAKAVELYGQALDIYRSISSKADLDCAGIEGELANLYREKGEYPQARALATQALDTTKSIVGEHHPEYGECLMCLGWIETETHHLDQAEAVERKAVDLYAATYGKDDPHYASALKSLARVYVAREEYAQAEPLYRQALQIVKKSRGEHHPEYAEILGEGALPYFWMGDVDRALTMSLQALEIDRQVLGENSTGFAIRLASLGLIYAHTHELARAQQCFERALALRTPIEGAASPTLHVLLTNLGATYLKLRNFEAAEQLFGRVIEIRRKSVGEKHPEFVLIRVFQAEVLFERGQYAQSEQIFRECLATYQQVFGDRHIHCGNCRYWLARIAMKKGQHKEAARLALSAFAGRMNQLTQELTIQSERVQLVAAADMRAYCDLVLSAATKDPDSALAAYDLILPYKGIVSSRQHAIRRLGREIRSSGNTEAAGLYDALLTATANLASLSRSTPDADDPGRLASQLQEASGEVERLETTLAEKSELFRNKRLQHAPSAKEIQSALPAGAVLVDLHTYLEFDPKRPAARPEESQSRTGSEYHVVAFILRAGRPQIECIDLGPTGPILQAVGAWREKFGRQTPASADPGQTLKNLIWAPLAAACRGAKLILISPDGDLARLPWNALPGERPGTFLIEDAAIGIVPIPAELPALLANSPHAETPAGLMLVGDVRFDGLPGLSGDKEASRAAPRGTRSGSMSHWSELPGTVAEDAAIKSTFRQRFPQASVVELTRDDATEKAVRRDAPRCQFLHFATHGYFAPKELRSALAAASRSEEDDSIGLFGRKDVSGFHPGLLSGLVLAGANRPVDVDHDDGILTALEVEALDLGSVDLATLSACETGLGQTQLGEGLLGLQRAFQTAGARSVVAGLWKVPDRATQALMERFYQNMWQKKLPKLEALREAQLWMIHEGPKQPGLTRGLDAADEPVETANGLSPYYWAAFVLSGDWR